MMLVNRKVVYASKIRCWNNIISFWVDRLITAVSVHGPTMLEIPRIAVQSRYIFTVSRLSGIGCTFPKRRETVRVMMNSFNLSPLQCWQNTPPPPHPSILNQGLGEARAWPKRSHATWPIFNLTANRYTHAMAFDSFYHDLFQNRLRSDWCVVDAAV